MLLYLNKLIGFTLAALFLSLLPSGCSPSQPDRETEVLVAAASDLAKAGPQFSRAFEKLHGSKVAFSFGASGQLEQQIRQGAPFDVFVPAARSYCESLKKDGLVAGDCIVFARGSLVAWSSAGEIHSLADLKQDSIRRVAIANPLIAPYGKAAQQALRAAGLWDGIRSKLVVADSVVQAFQMAQTGNVDVALVSRALVLDAGRPSYVVEPELYQPIEQTVAVLKASKRQATAGAFLELLASREGKQILEQFGFAIPNHASGTR